jgi:hypothetical protein
MKGQLLNPYMGGEKYSYRRPDKLLCQPITINNTQNG